MESRCIPPASVKTLHRNTGLRVQLSDFPRGTPLVLDPLDPTAYLEDTWPQPLHKPLCLPKIYVYPEDPRMGEFQRKHIETHTVYSSEIILLNQLRDPNSVFHKTYVTTNPDDADFFLIPFLGANYLMYCRNHLGHRNDDCEMEKKYVTPMMDHIQSNLPYWNRSHGRDHIIFHPMDLAALYYPTTRHRFLNATFLTTIGDKRFVAYGSQRVRRYHDITIPSATHMPLLPEYDPARFLDDRGFPLETWNHRRDIFVLFGGIYEDVQRTDRYSSGIRALLHEQGFDRLPGYKLSKWWEYGDYAQLLSRAKYGLAPQGWTLDTTRVWEYIAFGVVPVVIADGIIEPFEDDVDWQSFTVRISRSEAHRMDEILRSISEDEYERKRQAVWSHARQMLFTHDTWHLIVRQLCRMRFDLAGMQTLPGGKHVAFDYATVAIQTSMYNP
ncbi:hypothetical protein DFQ27_004415 [Actinomortierella ambigua]|uniref:Exostosin GT47 domain-containing protein n=1 Tax=Actinomortierella ambigua TaxID=1343610 RepID=A0A9P6Q620_9FUNG|nr:hypothetical protein DFQ27_004415 [Actinomortierella ambigua]